MKFKDAELIGVPTIVVVGKGFVDGVVEVKDRATGERTDVPLGDLIGPPPRLTGTRSELGGPRLQNPRRSVGRPGKATGGSPGELGEGRAAQPVVAYV